MKLFGRPKPFLLVGPLLPILTSGLLFWLMTTSHIRPYSRIKALLVTFQILFGLGAGAAVQVRLLNLFVFRETSVKP